MTSQHDPVDPIVAVQKRVKALLASADRVRAAGVVCLVGDEWLTVNVNLTVLHEGMEDPHPLAIESEGICAFDVLLGCPEIDEFLANLDAGHLRLPAACKSAVVPGIAHAHAPSFRTRFCAERDLNVAWPCDEVTIQGGGYQCDALATKFDRFLRSLPTMEPPIAGRYALQRELDLHGDVSVERGGGHVYLRRPLPVRFVCAGCTAAVNEFEIFVEAYGALAESFRVSVMPAAGRRSSSRIMAKEFERISESQFRKLLVVREPGAVKVTLTARDGEVADEVDTGVPWAPMLVHQRFDPECKVLGTLLVGSVSRGRRDPREFESGVAWLLHLCGCAAMHMGSKVGGMDLQGAPDIIARTPDGALLIAECSLLGPTVMKVEKLRERALAVAALLQRAGVPSRIRVVFFVGEPCDATFEGVEILDLVRIEDMLRRLRAGRYDGFCW